MIFYMQSPQEIIAIKPDYRPLGRPQIEQLVTGVVSDGFRDYQSRAIAFGVEVRLFAVWLGAIIYTAKAVACTNVMVDQVSES